MPVEESNNLSIACDNCGETHGLDPTVRTGWVFVTHEVYGEPTEQNVFGSFECASTKLTEIGAARANKTS
jgi:hypothetical protein